MGAYALSQSGGAAALVDAGHEGARALRGALFRVAAVEAQECSERGDVARARVARARPHGTRPDARADRRRERESEQRRPLTQLSITAFATHVQTPCSTSKNALS